MTFAAVNSDLVNLRSLLRTFVGESAIAEINVRPPARDNDEASFLRLVSWSYVTVYEAGRITIPYLLQLPSRVVPETSPDTACELIRSLRTWSFHNLGYNSDRDKALSQSVHRWFLKTCGSNPPDQPEEWQKCCTSLCVAVRAILAHCQSAASVVLSSDDDGQQAIKDLQQRLDRAWPAFEFDSLVSEAAVRLGCPVDVVKFRNSKLAGWREYLESLPDGVDMKTQVGRAVERDLLEHIAQVLPIDGRDLMEEFGLEAGPEVGTMLRAARQLFEAGVRRKEEIFGALRSERENPDRLSGKV